MIRKRQWKDKKTMTYTWDIKELTKMNKRRRFYMTSTGNWYPPTNLPHTLSSAGPGAIRIGCKGQWLLSCICFYYWISRPRIQENIRKERIQILDSDTYEATSNSINVQIDLLDTLDLGTSADNDATITGGIALKHATVTVVIFGTLFFFYGSPSNGCVIVFRSSKI